MRFPTIKNPNGSPGLKDLYQEITKSGFGEQSPINWFTSQAIRPDILKATWALVKGILVEGELPPTVKQLIAMTISAENQCRYCKVTHTRALQALGVPEEVIQTCAVNPDETNLPPQHRAIVQFALKSAKNPNSVTDADFEALREMSLSDGEILEIAMMAAFTNFINTWADVSSIPVDGE